MYNVHDLSKKDRGQRRAPVRGVGASIAFFAIDYLMNLLADQMIAPGTPG